MERYNWILYPEAKNKLQEFGLTRRITEAHRKFETEICYGIVNYSDVVSSIKSMREDKTFDAIPANERKIFFDSLQKLFNERSSSYWSVKKGEETKITMEPDDFLILSGFSMIGLLRKKESFDYKKFGFSNIFEFTGTVGAAIQIEGKEIWNGLKWETKRPEGTIIQSVISGDSNSDLRIIQTDITAYETRDPLGNRVFYRPQTEIDDKFVSAYHSTEGMLLASVLKYIDQMKLKPEIVEENAKLLIEFVEGAGQGGNTCAEHFGGFDKNPFEFFSAWNTSLPQLGENYKTNENSSYNLCTMFETHYKIAIGPKNELVISYQNRDDNRIVTFIPEDMDNLIKSIFYQAVNGIGRTSAKQLVDIIKYRFSDQLEKDQEETRKLLQKYSR